MSRNYYTEQHEEECRKRRRAEFRGKDLFTQLEEGKPLGRVSDTICCVFAFASVALDERKCTFMGYGTVLVRLKSRGWREEVHSVEMRDII